MTDREIEDHEEAGYVIEDGTEKVERVIVTVRRARKVRPK